MPPPGGGVVEEGEEGEEEVVLLVDEFRTLEVVMEKEGKKLESF